MKKILSLLFLLPIACSAQIWTQGTNFQNFGNHTNSGNIQTATERITTPGSAASVVNLALDANFNVVTNASPVGGGGSTVISNSASQMADSNVKVATIADGDVLTYVLSDHRWTNKPSAGGGDVTKAGNNPFTGSNNFAGVTLFSNNAAIDAAHQLYLSNLTASRAVFTDAGKGLVSAAASGAVPMDANGTATTFPQVAALAPGGQEFITNGESVVVNVSNNWHFSSNIQLDGGFSALAGSYVTSNFLVGAAATVGASNQVEFLDRSGGKAFQLNTNGPAWFGSNVTVSGKLTVNGTGPNILYGDNNQTNALVVSALGVQMTNANNGVLFDAAKGSVNFSNATASRVAFIGVAHDLTNGIASGAVPMNADTTASTASQINALFPSAIITNNSTLASMALTNLPFVTSVSIPPGAWFTNNVADGVNITAASSQNLTNTGDNFVFADSVTNTINGRFDLPWDWDAGVVRVGIRAFCSGTNASVPAAAPTNVVWSVRAAAIGDADRENVLTFGTAVLVTNGIPTNSYSSSAAITGDITVGNTPTTAKSILWQISRNGGMTGDTLTNSSLAISGVRIYYRTLSRTNFPTASP